MRRKKTKRRMEPGGRNRERQKDITRRTRRARTKKKKREKKEKRKRKKQNPSRADSQQS